MENTRESGSVAVDMYTEPEGSRPQPITELRQSSPRGEARTEPQQSSPVESEGVAIDMPQQSSPRGEARTEPSLYRRAYNTGAQVGKVTGKVLKYAAIFVGAKKAVDVADSHCTFM